MKWTLLFFFLFSCALPKSAIKEQERPSPVIKNYEPREMETYFQTTGVVQYLLPELPNWANFVSSAACYRDRSIRYLDMEKLRKSFSLDYRSSLFFQYLYNLEYREKVKGVSNGVLLFKDEEDLFYKISERIQSGLFPSPLPKYKRVSLIWIDPIISMEKSKEKIQALLKNREVEKGHPLFISLCSSLEAVELFLKKNQLDALNIKIISTELFSAFNSSGKPQSKISLDLTALFNQDQEIYLWGPKSGAPLEFEGNFKYYTYEIKEN